MEQPLVVDARGLEPPEPLVKALEAVSCLKPGQHVLLILEREPYPLYRILEADGHPFETQLLPDGVYHIRIWLGPNLP